MQVVTDVEGEATHDEVPLADGGVVEECVSVVAFFVEPCTVPPESFRLLG